jgi:hypothetical protein
MDKEIYNKIDELGRLLDIQKDKMVVCKFDSEQVEFIKGNDKYKKPWFVIDKNNKVSVLIDEAMIRKFANLETTNEVVVFYEKLKNIIWMNFPIDVDDVMSVAINELDSLDISEVLSMDIDKFVKNIKKMHPNLFVPIPDGF